MNQLGRNVSRVLGVGFSCIGLASACDRGCSSEPVEHVFPFSISLNKAVSYRVPRDGSFDDEVPALTGIDAELAAAAPEKRPSTYVPTIYPPPPLAKATEIDNLELPEERSSPPTTAEWNAAKRLRTAHPHCRARVVREWMSIACDLGAMTMRAPMGVARVVMGDATEVSTWTYVPPVKDPPRVPEVFEPTVVAAVFPLRRGDVRLVELGYLQQGAKFADVEAYTISVAWLEGMKSPDVTITE